MAFLTSRAKAQLNRRRILVAMLGALVSCLSLQADSPVPGLPWTNSLGMKFVPAGTNGILFAVWDVRVKDYQTFVDASGYQSTGVIASLKNGVWGNNGDSWQHPGFTQTPDDPVVGVNGDDIAAFLQWLTKKEQGEATLSSSQQYRSPTRAEWHTAAGTTQYPWGNSWPPSPNAENFAGTEARDADWPATAATINGYSDGFPRTSPVGSFSPNVYGLFDMGGNVRQICQDEDGSWYYLGSGWRDSNIEKLRLSYEVGASKPSRLSELGFRIVLVVSPDLVSSPNSSAMPPPSLPTPAVPPQLPIAPAFPVQIPTVKLTEDQARAVVLIKGDNAEGTGFLVKTADGPAVVTNIHVISNNPNLKITTSTGTSIEILSCKGATDRDLAMIAIKDGKYSYLDMATDVSATVQPGDEVITPGNSEGGEVMLNTDGKVLGLGPDRIEFDNPIYHGNSGGPVFHVKSGKVIGIVTEAIKVDVSDELDKASFASRNSAIGAGMRYFGLRLDTVPGWEAYDWRRFQNETVFLDQFDKRSRCLDCYLNAPDDDKAEDRLWCDDKDITKDNDEFFSQAQDADASQQMNADRVMWAEFSDIADSEMDAIQNPNNFYSFDRQRATDEVAYRKAIQAELNEINKDVSRLGSLPRTNNH